MKREVSAGGVVIRKVGRQWKVLLIRDMNDNWTFPKGNVETDENARACAIREIAEETGVRNIRFLHTLPDVRYTYKRGRLIDKTVHYFLFVGNGRERPVHQKEEGLSAAQWIPMRQALMIIGYPQTNRALLTKAHALLREHADAART